MSIADVETSKSDDEEESLADCLNGNSPPMQRGGTGCQQQLPAMTSSDAACDDEASMMVMADDVMLLNRHLKPAEPDTESIVSDISEIAEPLREHFVANVKIIHQEDLDAGNTMYPSSGDEPEIERNSNESEEDYQKRVKKINFLSLAQEFAELKKQNSSALPLNLHSSPTAYDFTDDDDLDDELSDNEELATPCVEEKIFAPHQDSPQEGFTDMEYQSRRDAGPYRGIRSESMPSLSLYQNHHMNWTMFEKQIEAAEEAKKVRRLSSFTYSTFISENRIGFIRKSDRFAN